MSSPATPAEGAGRGADGRAGTDGGGSHGPELSLGRKDWPESLDWPPSGPNRNSATLAGCLSGLLLACSYSLADHFSGGATGSMEPLTMGLWMPEAMGRST